MMQTLPTPHCQRGVCSTPATVVCHIDYPTNPVTGQRPFRWSKPMCDSCVKVERVGARFTNAVVSTADLTMVTA